MSVLIERAGPMMTLQDLGRTGYIGLGLSRGGAMDRLALLEAAALLGLPQPVAGIEMAGSGGVFLARAPLRFALTGAPMQAQIEGAPIAWNATHSLRAGERLVISGLLRGSYGYLTFAGGLRAPHWLGSPSAHLAAGLGGPIAAGDVLALEVDPLPDRPAQHLTPPDRCSGGVLRLMPGPQTALFDSPTRARLAQARLTRSAQSNRQGLRLDHLGAPFAADQMAGQVAGLISDAILCGDVQMTGAGLPYILMAECQTIGGYPRIGTVIGADLARAAQAPVGAELRFDWVSVAEADRLFQPDALILADLRRQIRPMRRDPAMMADLLAYQLIGGVTCGDDLERDG